MPKWKAEKVPVITLGMMPRICMSSLEPKAGIGDGSTHMLLIQCAPLVAQTEETRAVHCRGTPPPNLNTSFQG